MKYYLDEMLPGESKFFKKTGNNGLPGRVSQMNREAKYKRFILRTVNHYGDIVWRVTHTRVCNLEGYLHNHREDLEELTKFLKEINEEIKMRKTSR